PLRRSLLLVGVAGLATLLLAGTVAYLLARDLARRRAIEERVRASEERYSALFDQSPLNLFIVDVRQDGQLVYEEINPSFERSTGFAPEQIIGRSPTGTFAPRPAAEFMAAKYRECAETGARVQYELTLDLPTGRAVRRTV